MKKGKGFALVEGQEHFDRWLQVIRNRIKADYDEMILVTGYEGTGKSSLAYLIAQALDSGFGEERMILDGKEMLKLFSRLEPGSVLVWDEAVAGAFSRDAMTKEAKTIQKLFIRARAKRIITILVLPDDRWIDVIMREHRARWVLNLPRRGICIFKSPYRGNDGLRAWAPLFAIRFPKPEGPDFERYYKRKLEKIDEYSESVE